MTINSSIIFSKSEKSVITKAVAIENASQLEIECVAMIAGESSPCYNPVTGQVLRDPDTNNLTLFKYSPELILAYASNFSLENPINFNQDHIDGSFVGKITSLSTKEIEGNLALIAKGIIEEKDWVNKILENKFSGISIETYSNLSDLSQSKVTAISLLNSLPPACSKSKCRTSILTASSEEEIIKKIDNSDLIFTEEEQEFLDNVGIDTKASWDGPSSEKKLLDYSRDKNGDIVVSKIRKYFLIVNPPSGKNGKYNREDFKYPVATIINKKPDYVLDGLVAALKRSAGQGIDLKSKIRRIIIKRFGVDALPPSLKTKASLFLLETDTVQGDDLMVDSDETKQDVIETKAIEVATQTIEVKPDIVETKATEVISEVKTEKPDILETKATEVATQTIEVNPDVIETKSAELPIVTDIKEVKAQISVLTKAQMDEIVVKELQVESFDAAKDMIKELAELKSRVDDKAGTWQTDNLQEQLCDARKEIEELKKFKEAQEEAEIMKALPRGVWEGESEIDGQMVPKIKMIAKEIREGGIGAFLKYGVGSTKASSSEIITNPQIISTKGSSEIPETPNDVDKVAEEKKANTIKAVEDFKKRYIKQ